jgi:hypothetical protein
MPGRAVADLFIGRVVDRAAHVAGLDLRDAARFQVHGFQAPETPAAQDGYVVCGLLAHARPSMMVNVTKRFSMTPL